MSVSVHNDLFFLRECRSLGVKEVRRGDLHVEFFEPEVSYPSKKAGILSDGVTLPNEKDLVQLAIDDPLAYEQEIIDQKVF